MQMRALYYSVDKRKRAAEMRVDASECARAGYSTLAECLYESAELLCPSPREEDKDAHRVGKGYRSGKSESDNGVATRGSSAAIRGGGSGGGVSRPMGRRDGVAKLPTSSRTQSLSVGPNPRAMVGALASGRPANPGNHRRGVAANARPSPIAGAR